MENISSPEVSYHEGDPNENMEGKTFGEARAYCFYHGKLVIVYSPKKNFWTPPGGSIEPGESPEEAVAREVREETNMEVIYQEPIGYLDITSPDGAVRHTNSFCIVRPIGDFVADPDGDITEIKYIDPKDHKEYFPNWGKIGDHVMARALELNHPRH
jgi:8-oxo-dGTP pyrophosphatase MutT (NUDIX family)